MLEAEDAYGAKQEDRSQVDIEDVLARIDAVVASSPERKQADGLVFGVLPLLRSPVTERTLRADVADVAPNNAFYACEYDHLEDPSFVAVAYRFILGRPVDDHALVDLATRLEGGHLTRSELACALARSPEGLARRAAVRGGRIECFLRTIRRVPGLRGLVLMGVRVARLVRAVRHVDSRFAEALERDSDIVADANTALLAVRDRLTLLERNVLRVGETAAEALGAAEEFAATRLALIDDLRNDRRTIPTVAGYGSPGAANACTLPPGLDAFYLAFENRFRGSREVILDRQRRYVSMVGGSEPVRSGAPVLDVGCGRGEWLRLLADAGASVRGVDLNSAMVEAARSAGFAAECGDGIALLERALPGTLGAVSAFHVVEHFGFVELVRFLDATYAALAENGVVLLETPNPENLVVGACTFHVDPTHVRPLPPAFLAFLLEQRGFSNVRIIRSDKDCDLSRAAAPYSPEGIEDWFRAPPDYAVFAIRSGGSPTERR